MDRFRSYTHLALMHQLHVTEQQKITASLMLSRPHQYPSPDTEHQVNAKMTKRMWARRRPHKCPLAWSIRALSAMTHARKETTQPPCRVCAQRRFLYRLWYSWSLCGFPSNPHATTRIDPDSGFFVPTHYPTPISNAKLLHQL